MTALSGSDEGWCSPDAGTLLIDPMTLLDPELRERMTMFLTMTSGVVELDDSLLPRFREGAAQWVRPTRADVSVQERMIPGPQQAPPVKITVINEGRNPVGQARPVILHFHGGGLVSGAPSNDIAKLQDLAVAQGCIVVSVDYRLAPETRFPGARDDNYAALLWLHANGATLGADPQRIVLLGESAGGGHVAQLALHARDQGEVAIKAQIMLYPMLDDRTGASHAAPAHIGAFMWTPALNRYGWRSYLGAEPGAPDAPPGAVPAREADLSGLPPTWIGVGALDLFVHEDIIYAQRLVSSGVPTELVVAPGAVHGFNELAPTAAVSRSFDASWHAALARAFAG